MPDVRFATAADLPGLAAVEASGDALFETVFGPIDWPAPVSGESRAAEPGFLLVVGSPVPCSIPYAVRSPPAAETRSRCEPLRTWRGTGRSMRGTGSSSWSPSPSG